MAMFGLGRRGNNAGDGVRATDVDSKQAAAMQVQTPEQEREAADRERRRAYDAGRADERARRRRRAHPLLSAAVLLIAIVGVVWIVLAFREGSFAGGGAVVDQKLANTAEPGKQALRSAADRSGNALQSAGQALERQGERLKKAGP